MKNGINAVFAGIGIKKFFKDCGLVNYIIRKASDVNNGLFILYSSKVTIFAMSKRLVFLMTDLRFSNLSPFSWRFQDCRRFLAIRTCKTDVKEVKEDLKVKMP